MTDEMNHDELDRLLRDVDPLASDAKPGEQESRAALNEFRARRAASAHAGTRARFARPRVLAGGTVALGASATAATLALGAFSSSPAFAVTPNSNGTVTVKVFRAGHVGAINARLEAMGVNAKFVQVTAVAASSCAPGEVLPHAIVIKPGAIPSHRTVVLGADRAGRVGYLPEALAVRIAQGHPAQVTVAGHPVQVAGAGRPVQVTAGATSTTYAATGTLTTQMSPAPAGASTATTTSTTSTDTSTTGTSTTAPGTSTPSAPLTARPLPPGLLHMVAPLNCAAQGTRSTDSSTTSTDSGTATTSLDATPTTEAR